MRPTHGRPPAAKAASKPTSRRQSASRMRTAAAAMAGVTCASVMRSRPGDGAAARPSAASKAAIVRGPTTPSAGSPREDWKARTAASVAASKSPVSGCAVG